MEGVIELNKQQLIGELKKRKLPTTGNVNTLRNRLKSFFEEQLNGLDQEIERIQNEEEVVQNRFESLSFIDKKIEEKRRELERLKQSRLNAEVHQREEAGFYNHRDFDLDSENGSNVIVNGGLDYRRNDQVNSTMNVNRSAAMFTFRDIENSMNTFSGSDNYGIECFIEEFEENARMLKWNDDQRVVYGKRLLRGKAKLLIRTVVCSTWVQLKKELHKEFGKKLSIAEAHRLLQSTKMQQGDDTGEYVLKMRELARNNNIDEKSLVEYIVEGIHDYHSNKVILYGASSIEELKIKLLAYEKFKGGLKDKNPKNKQLTDSKTKDNASEPKKNMNERSSNSKENKRCFLCGDSSHIQNACPTKEKGLKCFKCNDFGHRACDKICPKYEGKREEKIKDSSSLNFLSGARSIKEVEMCGKKIRALFDTGSEINVIKSNLFQKLKISYDIGSARKFIGLGGAKIVSNKFFMGKVGVDGEVFDSKIFIFDDNEIEDDLIIGMELMLPHRVTFECGQIKMEKLNENVEEMGSSKEVTRIMNIVVDGDELDGIPEKVKSLIENYRPKKPKDTDIVFDIQLEDDLPVYTRPRRLANVEKEIVEKQIEEWIKEGVIKRGSSNYAATVVVKTKKNGKHRICIDYRKLNKKIIRDRFPTPNMEDVLETLQDSLVYCTIDLKNGFFHVPVGEKSQKYLSFVTHSGQYLFLKTPFGCCNSPAVFMRYINEVFRDLINKGIVIVYMDDVAILAKSEDEAIERLKIVLDVAAEAGLQISWQKCQFLKRSIEFLGHVVENGTIRPSPAKQEAVRKFKELKNVKEVQSFLGLTGAFRKFIKDYALIARPLSNLLRKGVQFKFEEEEKKAFGMLKLKLIQEPVLKMYRQNAETQLFTDASKLGFGAILMQKSADDDQFHPVYYMSIKTSPVEEKYDSYTLEVLAIVKALEKFRNYLLGTKFKIITDCEAFTKTMQKQEIIPKIARWVMAMQEFSFEIEHRTSEQMKHVDAFSRVLSVVSVEDNLTIKIRKMQNEDNGVNRIRTILQHQDSYEAYMLRNGILYKYVSGRDLLVVPEAMEAEVIKASHGNGHFGIKKVEEDIGQQFFIVKAKEKIKKFIGNCVQCILIERKRGKGEGFLHPIDKGDSPLDTYHIDHLGPMVATTKLYKYLFVVIDAFSKFTWIYPTKTTNAKEAIDKLKIQQQIFGNPRRIISDKGTAFTSDDFKQFCEIENIQHIKTTTGMPRANGQVERVNESIIPVLSKLALDNPEKWFKYVSSVQQALNGTFHRSISTTPFKLLFGVNMKSKLNLNVLEALEESFIKQFEKQRDEERDEAKKQIIRIQDENSSQFNKKRKQAKSYDINDLVAIKRTQFVNGNKLAEKFFGPYRISKVKSNERYDVIKEGNHAGPKITSTSAEYIKSWCSSEADE